MQWIGNLIGLYPYVAWCNLCTGAPDLAAVIRKTVRQVLMDSGSKEGNEWEGKKNLFFKQETLALVDTQITGLSNRQSIPPGRQTILVARMTGFVGRCLQRINKVFTAKAGGDPVISSAAG